MGNLFRHQNLREFARSCSSGCRVHSGCVFFSCLASVDRLFSCRYAGVAAQICHLCSGKGPELSDMEIPSTHHNTLVWLTVQGFTGSMSRFRVQGLGFELSLLVGVGYQVLQV